MIAIINIHKTKAIAFKTIPAVLAPLFTLLVNPKIKPIIDKIPGTGINKIISPSLVLSKLVANL